PLAALGRVSYGVYLFHWPIFLWLTGDRTGLPPVRLFLLRCLATVSLAAASYTLIERPVRTGVLPRPVGLAGWADGTVAFLAALALVASVAPRAGRAPALAAS